MRTLQVEGSQPLVGRWFISPCKLEQNVDRGTNGYDSIRYGVSWSESRQMTPE